MHILARYFTIRYSMSLDLDTLTGISIDRLRSFCLVVESGSIVSAANRDPGKQSLYSRQIRDLEEAFETKLFRREGKYLRLTVDGVRLASITSAYFSALGELARSGNGGRPISIGAAESIVRWVLAPRMAEVTSAAGRPIDIHTLRTSDAVARLEAGSVDVAILRADAVTDGLATLPFPSLEYVLIAPRSILPERHGTTTGKLGVLPIVLLTGDGRFVQSAFKVARENGFDLRVVMRVESLSLAAAAAKTLEAAVFVPTQARGEFPADQYACLDVEGIRSLDRPLVVAYSAETEKINSRPRRFAARLSRIFETPTVQPT